MQEGVSRFYGKQWTQSSGNTVAAQQRGWAGCFIRWKINFPATLTTSKFDCHVVLVDTEIKLSIMGSATFVRNY